MISLMYHDVVPEGAEDSSGFPGRDAALYKVTVDQFAQHLDAICSRVGSACGHTEWRPELPPRGISDSSHWEWGPSATGKILAARAPLLTFDDGGVSALVAADHLQRRGLRGYFFVTTDYLGTRGFLDASMLRDLDRRGHLIGSHSCSHPLRIGHCSWPRLIDEWARSRVILSEALGHAVSVASIPGGDNAPAVAEAAARAGFTDLFTSEPTTVDRAAFGLILRGRFIIRRRTTASAAAALAAGDLLPCARQALAWKAAKLGKQLAGRHYLRIRKLLIGHGDEVRWGDSQGSDPYRTSLHDRPDAI